MLGTLLVQPPPTLDLVVSGNGDIDVQWSASPSAASRPVEYLVLRRASGTGAFSQLARTADVLYTDHPAAGTYEYVVRTVVSTFTSADSPMASASTPP